MAEATPIVARYRLTLAEIQNSLRWHQRQGSFHGLLMLGIGVVLVFGVIQTVQQGFVAALATFLLAGIFVVLRFVVQPLQIRWHFSKRTDRDDEIEWTFSEDRIHSRAPKGSAEFAWSALAKAVQTPDGLLLYPNPQLFYWVPRHAFGNEGEFGRLVELAKTRAPKFETLR